MRIFGGTKEVVALLERQLQTAKTDDFAFGAIALCRMTPEGLAVVTEFRGDLLLERAGKEAVKVLLARLDRSIANWELPERDHSLDASFVVCDLSHIPLGFDYINWLIACEMQRRREGAPTPLKVGFWLGREPNNDATTLKWVNNVFRPALSFIGAVEDPKALRGRNSLIYMQGRMVAAFNAGETIPILSTNLPGEPGVISITLREAVHHQNRNSDLEAWYQFGCWLQDQGERVVVIRDTAKAHEPFGRLRTAPAASVHLTERMALYANAKCNLCVGNGPWALMLYSDRPWLQFLGASGDENDPDPVYRPLNWKRDIGVPMGGQFPWSRPNQRIVWKPDTFANLRAAWEAIEWN